MYRPLDNVIIHARVICACSCLVGTPTTNPQELHEMSPIPTETLLMSCTCKDFLKVGKHLWINYQLKCSNKRFSLVSLPERFSHQAVGMTMCTSTSTGSGCKCWTTSKIAQTLNESITQVIPAECTRVLPSPFLIHFLWRCHWRMHNKVLWCSHI